MIKELAAIAYGVTDIAVGVTKHVLGYEEPEHEPTESSSIGIGGTCDASTDQPGGERQTTLSEYGF